MANRMEQLQRMAFDLAETFINGNRNDTRKAIFALPTQEAVIVAMEVYQQLDKDNRVSFRRAMEHGL